MPHFLRTILEALLEVQRSRGLLLVLTVVGLLSYGTFGFYWFEAEGALAGLSTLERIETSMWWTIVSMTTVGYGDVFPKTWQGRWLVAVPLLVFGIGILGYAIGVLTGKVIDRQSKELKGMIPYTKSGHIIICNCPSEDLVLEIARELGCDPNWRERKLVLVTDAFAEESEEMRRAGIHFIAGNPCRERSLERANIAGAHRVMVLTQDPAHDACDSVTLGVVVTVRSLNPGVYIVAECQHGENYKLLRAAKADEIVSAVSLRAELMVQGLQDPGINDLIEEILTNTRGAQLYVHTIAEFTGTYEALLERLRKVGNFAPIGLVHDDKRRLLPPPDTAVVPGDKLILLGDERPGRL